MIRELTSFEPYRDFIRDINADPVYFDPMLSTEEQIEGNLLSAQSDPDKTALGVFEDGVMTGLFVFLIIKEERYVEMLVGLTARSVSLSWGAREVGSPCEWRGGARHVSRAMVGESGLETC